MAAPPEPETSPRIERIEKERVDAYGAVVATVFGMVPPLDRWFAALAVRPRWECFGAFDGDRLVATGAAHLTGRLAWLGAAGTLSETRGRGAQVGDPRSTIRVAADAGARVLAVETVDRVDGESVPSFRNVVRAGSRRRMSRRGGFHRAEDRRKRPQALSNPERRRVHLVCATPSSAH